MSSPPCRRIGPLVRTASLFALTVAICASVVSLAAAQAPWRQSPWGQQWNATEKAPPVRAALNPYARPSSTPLLAYGGHGPRAQLLPRPGEVAWSKQVRPPVRYASRGPIRGEAPMVGVGPYRTAAAHDGLPPAGHVPPESLDFRFDPYAASSHSAPSYGAPPQYGGYGSPSYAEDTCYDAWSWQIVPEGLLYPVYLAGVKEPRMGAVLNKERNDGWKWDLSIGGRFGVLRYGTKDVRGGDGWQLDVEAAAQPRLDPEQEMELEATDYRFGIPVTYGNGRYRMKIGYFHLSSHLGDEYAIRNGLAGRINYSRDAILWGHSYQFTDALTGYVELGYGAKVDVNEPWDLQFGFDYSPPCECGFRGAPFFAANAHLREEVDFGGNGVLQAGWQWRSEHEGHLMRIGVQYYNGKHERYEFYNTSEQKFGFGIWYDF